MSRAAPGRLLQLGVFPQIWSLCGVTGGAGGGEGAGFLWTGGGRGESAGGRLTSSPWQPFKPLTQPAPHPVCPSPDRAHAFQRAPRNPCKCICPGSGGELGWGSAVGGRSGCIAGRTLRLPGRGKPTLFSVHSPPPPAEVVLACWVGRGY